MDSALKTYLQNHEAAAQAGRDAFRRSAANQRSSPRGELLATLTTDIEQDLRTLRRMMRRLHIAPNPVLAVGARLGERVSRHKPNGRLVRRSPLSDLIEVEGLMVAVRAKAAGWESLLGTDQPVDPRLDRGQLDRLLERAHDQITLLEGMHRDVAAAVLPN